MARKKLSEILRENSQNREQQLDYVARINQAFEENTVNLPPPQRRTPPTIGQQAGYVGGRFISGVGSSVLDTIGALPQSMAVGYNRAAQQSAGEQSVAQKRYNTLKNLAKYTAIDPMGRLLYNATLGREDYINNLKNTASQMQANYDKADNVFGKIGAVLGGATSNAIQENNPIVNKIYDTTQLAGQLQGQKAAEEKRNKLLELDKKIHEPTDKLNEKLDESREDYGKVTQFLGDVSSTMGYMTPSIALSAMGGGSGLSESATKAIGLTQMGLASKGQSTREGLKQGLDLETAERKGVATGTAEAGSELMFDGLKAFKKFRKSGFENAARKWIEDTVEKKIKSALGQKLTKGVGNWLLDVTGEGIEEIVTDIYGTWLENATTDPNKQYTLEDAANTFLMTMATTTGLNLGTTAINNIQNRTQNVAAENQAQTYLNEAQKIINQENLTEKLRNKVAQEVVSKAEETTTDNTQQLPTQQTDNRNVAINEINNSRINTQEKQQMIDILNNMDDVSTEDLAVIRETIQNANKANMLPTNENYKESQQRRQTYAKYKNDTSNYDSSVVNSVLDTIPANRNGNRTVKQWLQAANNIGQQISDLSNEEIEKIAYKSWFDLQPTKNITQYDNQAKQKVGFQKLTSDEWINTINNAVNQARENQPVQQVTPSIQQSTVTPSDDLISSAKKYNLKYQDSNLNQVQNVFKNKGIDSRFDASKFTDNRTGAMWQLTRDQDGNVRREIILNPNADEKTVIQEMAIHELTHDIVAKNTDTSTKLYNEVRDWLARDSEYQKQLDQLKSVYGDNVVEEEAIAKTLQTKFGNQESIDNLVNYNPSMARRIYDWVVDKLNKITGGKIEKLYWEDVKNKFEKAYSEQGNYSNANSAEKNSIAGTNAQNANIDQLNEAIKLEQQGKNPEEIFKKTGWFRGNEGKWRFEIGNENANIATNLKGKDLKFRNDYNEEFIKKTREKLKNPELNQDQLNFWKAELKFSEKNLKAIDKIDLDLNNIESFNNANNIKAMTNRIYLSDIFKNNEELFKAYPFLNKIEIKLPFRDSINREDAGTLGYVERRSFDDIPEKIYITKQGLTDNYGLKKILLHEIQHAIQAYEGFSNGSSDVMWENKLKSDARNKISRVKKQAEKILTNKEGRIDANYYKVDYQLDNLLKARLDLYNLGLAEKNNNQEKISQILTEEGYYNIKAYKQALYEKIDNAESLIKFYTNEKIIEKMDKIISDITKINKKAFKLYKNTAGEIEAREVEKRADWNEEKRKENLPFIKNRNTVYYENVDNDYKQPKSMLTNTENQENSFNLPTTDNQGRTLSKQQQEFFKDSKARDENGNLKSVYHGTASDFTTFNKDFQTEGDFGKGFYFTDSQGYAEYSADVAQINKDISKYKIDEKNGKVMEVYLDMKNPAVWKNYTDYQRHKRIAEQKGKTVEEYLRENYDGIIVEKPNYDGEPYSDAKFYVVFNPEQIKNVDNTNPTQNPDIRYSDSANFDEYIQNRVGKQGTRTALEELKLPVQQQTTEQTTSVLPTRKTMNPTEISQLTEADATTTPQLPTREYRKGNKQSNFAANILGDAQFIDKDIRQTLAQEDNVRYYQGITNEQTLAKAYKSLQDGGATETMKWYNKKDNITPEDVAKGWILLKQYQDAGDIQSMIEVAKKMRTMGTQAGQTVQAYNILSRLTPEGMFYYSQSELSEAFDKFSKGKTQKWIDEHRSEFELTPEETQFIKDKMETVQNTNDERTKKVALAEIQSMLQNKIPPTVGQSVKAWMRISMLFNPKTQVRNVMGNAVILPVNATSDVISGAIDKAIARKTGVRTTGVTKEGLKGYAQGFKRGLFESYEDFRKGINTRNIEGNRFEIGEGKSFKDKGIGKALNAVDNILSFSLDAGDRGFYEATFTNSINNQMVLNNTTEVTPEMIEIATNEALQRTWQDNNEYTKAVLGIRNILNKVNVKGYGLGDVLIPFAKTPANLTKAIVDYSPVGLAKTLAVDARRFNNSLKNGQYSVQAQHNFVQNMGKGIAGTFLYVLGSALAKAGVISGEADDDKDLKNFMKNTLGINSYSIKLGDRSFTYDWAQPVATPFAIMSNYEKYSKDNPDANALEKGIKALNIGSEQLLEQSFMESINTVLNGNGTTLENLSKAVLDLPARAIPTFSKQIADLVDSKQRTSFEYGKPVESAFNSLKSKLPFVSRTLPESKDTLGNTIEKYGGENNIFNVMLNPANVNKSTLNKAGKEIYDVYMSTGDTTIFPRVAPYYINSKGEKTTLTSEQRSKFQEISGKYVENAVNGLLNNKDYNNMKNEDKAKLINEIVTDSYSKAKYDVLGMDTDSYKKTRETLKDVSTTTYYDYKIKTSSLKKDKEKLEVLADANYKDKEKEKIYREYFNKDDDLFDIAKKAKIDTSQYLKYKANIENTKASAVDYLKNANISNEQKLLLLGTKYALSNQEKSTLAKYINNLNITKNEKLDIYQQLKGFNVNGDKVSW